MMHIGEKGSLNQELSNGVIMAWFGVVVVVV
jgi:hypothetical protein